MVEADDGGWWKMGMVEADDGGWWKLMMGDGGPDDKIILLSNGNLFSVDN